MKKLLAVSMFLVAFPALSLAGPKILVPQTHWDYGNVPQNNTISHDYWIKNIGDDTLKIINVKPG